jgi:hypothetical protein
MRDHGRTSQSPRPPGQTPGRRRRRVWTAVGIRLAVLLAASLAVSPGVRPAVAQPMANPIDDAMAAAGAAAMPGPGAGGGNAVAIGQAPTVPRPASRPKGWPGRDGPSAKSAGAIDNHVLSSILPNPGAPLDLVDGGLTAADVAVGGKPGPSVGKSGVVQAGFEEVLPTGPGGEGRPLVAQSLDNAKVIARVGPEVVLQGDLLTPSALAWLDKVSGGLTPEQIAELKLQICKQVMSQHIESLLVYIDACRTIPEERLPEIEKKVNEAFDQQQLPRMVKDAGLASAAEFEQLLRSRGQSLDRIRKMFFERALAQQWIQQKVMNEGEIPHAEMIAWYQNHLADYDYPARARFEQITVKITPQRARPRAWNTLAGLGNQVFEGRPFADVAKAHSEGPTAATGGAYDWTTRGSLVSKAVDEAIFSLPVGQLSAILEDGSALHIVRVIERVDAGRIPFIEAQVAIRERLSDERRKKVMDEYLVTVRERTPVWTVFDDQPGGGPIAAAKPSSAQPRTTR